MKTITGPMCCRIHASGETARGITLQAVKPSKQKWSGGVSRFKTVGIEVGIEHRILDAIQGHRPRNVAEGYGEVTIKMQAAAIAKLPRSASRRLYRSFLYLDIPVRLPDAAFWGLLSCPRTGRDF